MKIIEHGL